MYPMNITFLPRFNCFKQGEKKKKGLKTHVRQGGFVLWSLPGEMATVETGPACIKKGTLFKAAV